MRTKWTRQTAAGTVLSAALVLTGCGEYLREGRGASLVVIASLQAAPGSAPDEFGGTLLSDVITIVERTVRGEQIDVPTIFNDLGEVTMSLIPKNPGSSGATASPSDINQVTFSRYRVTYRRADGRNTPGIDIPYPFDSGLTFTVPASGSVTAGFQIVRQTAKAEAPLAALAIGNAIIATIAEVSFYGRDQAGNDVTASATIGIDFGNFADPI